MSEFGGLWKHEKTQHARVGLGSAALAAAVALTRLRWPKFPTRDTYSVNRNKKKGAGGCSLTSIFTCTVNSI